MHDALPSYRNGVLPLNRYIKATLAGGNFFVSDSTLVLHISFYFCQLTDKTYRCISRASNVFAAGNQCQRNGVIAFIPQLGV